MNAMTRTTILLVIAASLIASASFAATLEWKGFTWTIGPAATVAEVLPNGNLHTVHEQSWSAQVVAETPLEQGRTLIEVSYEDYGPDNPSIVFVVTAKDLSNGDDTNIYASCRPWESAFSYENGRSGFYGTFGTREAGDPPLVHTFRLVQKSDSSIEYYIDGVLVHTDTYFKDGGRSFYFRQAILYGYGIPGGADNTFTDFKALSGEGTLPGPVSGQVILSNFDTANKWWTTAVGVEFIQNSVVVQRQTVLIDSSGNFTTSSVPAGTYDVALKGSQFLRKVVPGVEVNGLNGTTQIGSVTLVNGDLDGDNEITTTDLSTALIPGLGTQGDQ